MKMWASQSSFSKADLEVQISAICGKKPFVLLLPCVLCLDEAAALATAAAIAIPLVGRQYMFFGQDLR